MFSSDYVGLIMRMSLLAGDKNHSTRMSLLAGDKIHSMRVSLFAGDKIHSMRISLLTGDKIPFIHLSIKAPITHNINKKVNALFAAKKPDKVYK